MYIYIYLLVIRKKICCVFLYKEVNYFLNYIFLKMFCVKDGNYYFPINLGLVL